MRRLILPAVLLIVLQACSAMETVRRPAKIPRIEVVHCRLAPSIEIVDVQVRIYGKDKFTSDPAATYLVDEGTGEKYYLMVLKRIGRLAEIRDPEEEAVHSITFKNPDGKLKAGNKVTVVVDGLRQEHVVVGK